MATRDEEAAEWRVNRYDVEWDELYATTRAPEVINPAFREALLQAIAAKRVIRFTTCDDSQPRRAEPHVYGRSAHRDRVLLHPDWSDRNPMTSLGSDWRLIDVANLTSLEVLEVTFALRTLPSSMDPDNTRTQASRRS
jgi:hypothetical protein